MKSIVLAVFIFVLTFTSIAQTDTIYWKANQKLSWADFRGSITDSAYNAVSVTEIKPIIYCINQTYILKSECYFLANESYKKSDWMNDVYWYKYGLEHEQIHFNIDQHFTLIFDSIVNSTFLSLTKIEDYRNKTDSIFRKIKHDADLCQSKYDKETVYGLNQGRQQEWKKIVDDRILYLLEFNKKWYINIHERTPKIK
ncbi:MAG: hypothetical protein AB7P01_13725 [Bacteroidia bacterium]